MSNAAAVADRVNYPFIAKPTLEYMVVMLPIPPEQATAALAELANAGWRPIQCLPITVAASRLEGSPAALMVWTLLERWKPQ